MVAQIVKAPLLILALALAVGIGALSRRGSEPKPKLKPFWTGTVTSISVNTEPSIQLSASDFIVRVTAGKVVNLPSVHMPGARYCIVNTDGNASPSHPLTVKAHGSKIDGASDLVLTEAYSSVCVIDDGFYYFTL